MTYSVHVSNIAPTSTEPKLHEFFSFCGKIESIDFKGTEATIHFEKASSVHTARMLHEGTLDGNQLVVTSELDPDHPDDHTGEDTGDIRQTDKPRVGIAAEYLAKSYKLSDNVLKEAIKLDNKHGISPRFKTYLASIDKTVGSKALGPEKTISGKVTETFTAATQQVRSIDEQKGYSKMAGDLFNQYYSWARSLPVGQQVADYYASAATMVSDTHKEAVRIAGQDTKAAPETAAPAPAAT